MTLELADETQFGHMLNQVGKMMEQMQKGFFNFRPSETWAPDVNLYENDAAYIVCVDLSGVDKDKIELTIADSQLRLRGQRTVPILPGQDAQTQRLRVHLMEIDHGQFCREVQLPKDVEKDQISARYIDGMLWIEIPKR